MTRKVHKVEHFFFSSRRRHTRLQGDWSSDVCSSDLHLGALRDRRGRAHRQRLRRRRRPHLHRRLGPGGEDRKSTRLNSSHLVISYAVFCLKKKKKIKKWRIICNKTCISNEYR